MYWYRAWTPIDWGFNPFKVDKFVDQIVLDHVLLNTVDLYSVQGTVHCKNSFHISKKVEVAPELNTKRDGTHF